MTDTAASKSNARHTTHVGHGSGVKPHLRPRTDTPPHSIYTTVEDGRVVITYAPRDRGFAFLRAEDYWYGC